MNLWKEFIGKIPEEAWRQMVDDHREFERDGMIGDCLLRSLANAWLEMSDSGGSPVMWMEALAKEAYRYFAYKHLSIKDER